MRTGSEVALEEMGMEAGAFAASVGGDAWSRRHRAAAMEVHGEVRRATRPGAGGGYFFGWQLDSGPDVMQR